jgi:hypothetical protein
MVLLFILQLVLFSSNYFDLGANFFGNWPFLYFRESSLDLQEFSSRKLALSNFWQVGYLFLGLGLCNLHFFFKIMLIAATTL